MGILFINIVNMYQDSMDNIDVQIITDACISIIFKYCKETLNLEKL